MASEVPEYFLPRNWNYPPSGPIKLGNVFASLKEPHRPIATVQPGVESIITSRRTLATIETENARSGGVTLMTTFMSALLGAGVDASVDVGKSSGRVFTFDTLDTSYVNTADDDNENAETSRYEAYIRRCVEAPLVLRYLKRCRFLKHVYIITGIKTVSGAKCYTSAAHTVDGLLGAQVDGTIVTGGVAPLGGGPEIRGGRRKKLNISWEGSTEFVLAYKVSKVTVNEVGDVKKEKEALKGAFLEDAPKKNEAFVLDIKHVDQPVNEHGFAAVAVVEGDEKVHFGIPEAED